MARFAASALLAIAGGGGAQDVFLSARQLHEASADSQMVCPNGWEQVGKRNADIQGCGLEECTSRYFVPTLQACSQKCEWSGLGCKAFSWAPRGGDRDHPDEQVCSLYGTSEATQVWGPNQILCKREEILKCPQGWVEPDGANDIQGCGLQGCDSRYSVPSLEACSQACDAHGSCRAFTWAPIGGDRDHLSKKVCSLYDVREPDQYWGPKQLLCRKELPELQCPGDWMQVGGHNANIPGCGLEGCAGRYTVPSIEACSQKCQWSGLGCKAFSWAPVNGDRNHVDEKVCTIYGSDTQHGLWGPQQILCKPYWR